MIRATRDHKTLVIDILCESFDTNKSVNYVVKQDMNRKKRLRRLMEYSFDVCYMFGQIYLSDDKKACALILFPDQKKTTLKTILLDAKLAVACVGLGRISKVLDRDSKIKSAYPKDPILYLWFIGVIKDEQHKGIGSSLLSELIKESISVKRPIYLETSMPENVKFYKKFGFDVYKDLNFGHQLFLIRRNLN